MGWQNIIKSSRTALAAPTYFTAQFPPFAIDGEIFSERNQFEEIASITKSFKDDNWTKLILYVFDVPNASGNLFERLKNLEDYLKDHPTPYHQDYSANSDTR